MTNGQRVSALVALLNEKETQLGALRDGVTTFASQQTARSAAAAEKAVEQDAQAATHPAGPQRLTGQTEDALRKPEQALQLSLIYI